MKSSKIDFDLFEEQLKKAKQFIILESQSHSHGLRKPKFEYLYFIADIFNRLLNGVHNDKGSNI
jgi:hypothetical protein